MTYQIVKNMPMPDMEFGQNGIKQVSKYPFYKMELRDCVIFDDKKTAQVAWSSAYGYAARTGNDVKFEKRKLEDGRWGIWRTK
jgi:hypothetical protein